MKEKNKIKIINRKASFNYELIESFTAGICLKGTEIKSIKESNVSFNNGFCFFKKNDTSFRLLGLNTTLAFPPILNQEYFERLSSNKISPSCLGEPILKSLPANFKFNTSFLTRLRHNSSKSEILFSQLSSRRSKRNDSSIIKTKF